METMGRDAVETIKITGRGMWHMQRRWRQWALVLFLSLAAIAFAFPRLQTAAAIALALLAYNVLTTDWGRYAGPLAGIAARVVRTQMLFVEDSAGRARAWLGVEDEYGDEPGARLVFYDRKGRAASHFALSIRDSRRTTTGKVHAPKLHQAKWPTKPTFPLPIPWASDLRKKLCSSSAWSTRRMWPQCTLRCSPDTHAIGRRHTRALDVTRKALSPRKATRYALNL